MAPLPPLFLHYGFFPVPSLPAYGPLPSLFILPTLTFSLSDLERYFRGLGPPPKFQVTLNFLEEDPDPSHTPQSLISVQVSPGQGENSCLCRGGGPGEGPWGGQGWWLPCCAHDALFPPLLAQMEQAFARHLLTERPEVQAATLSLVQSLEDLPSSSLLGSPYFL